MSKFKVGDEVTLIKECTFIKQSTKKENPNQPRFGAIYTVSGVFYGKYIELKELDSVDVWNEKEFEKVISDRVLSEELETVKETVHDMKKHPTVSQFVADMRQARDMLRNRNQVKAVAITLGYNSSKSFWRSYKAFWGTSPET